MVLKFIDEYHQPPKTALQEEKTHLRRRSCEWTFWGNLRFGGNRKHAMQIQNPQFYVNQSLSNQRKLKRSGFDSMVEVQDLAKTKREWFKMRRTMTLGTKITDKIDLSKEPIENNNKKRGTMANFMGLKFNPKFVNKKKVARLETKNSKISNSSKINKNDRKYVQMQTISKFLLCNS